MTEKAIDKVMQSFIIFDLRLTQNIKHYLEDYIPYDNPPFFAAYSVNFIKIIFYSLCVIIPFLFLKILHPYSQKVTFVIILILLLIAFSVGGVFLGFFQLAWTF